MMAYAQKDVKGIDVDFVVQELQRFPSKKNGCCKEEIKPRIEK